MSTRYDTLTTRCAVACANWILRTFAPDYSKFVAGAIEYGMRSAAEDSVNGSSTPGDWRVGATPGGDA